VTATVASAITNDATARQLRKSGDGVLVLSGTNTYSGATRIEGGVLSVADLTNAGSGSAIGAYPVAGPEGLTLVGGTFQYSGGTTTVDRGFTLSGDSTIDIAAPGTALTLGGCAAVDISGTLTSTGETNCSLRLGRVTLVEGTSMTLNSIGGGMTVDAVRGYTSYPLLPPTITLTGTTTGNVVTGNMFTENPPGSPYARSMNVAKSGSGDWTVEGVISVSGTVDVDGGMLTLTGNNSFSGQLTIRDATLSVPTVNNHNANGPLGGGTKAVILGGSAGRIGTLEYTGATASGSKKFTMATGGTGVFDVVSGETELTLTGVIDGGGGLVKTGEGTLVLAGDNTFAGDTIVESGTLGVAGSSTLSDSAALWIDAGAIVDLADAVNESVTNLYLNARLSYTGTWGSSASAAEFRNDTYFTGTGILTVLDGPEGAPGMLIIVR